MNTESIWKMENDLFMQRVACVGIFFVGLLLIYAARNYGVASFKNNAFCGYVLGWMLSILGIGAFVFGKKQVITINPHLKNIIIQNIGRVSSKTITVWFKDIDHTSVGFIGKASNGYRQFHVVLHLKTGKTIPLYAGFYQGSTNRSIVEDRANRIERLVLNSIEN